MKPRDKVIIITGASAGIGLATAELLAREGARLVLAARSREALEALAARLPQATAVPTDMRDPAAVRQMVEATVKRFGRVDILINNAGQGIYAAVENADIDGYRSVFEVNVVGPLVAMQTVIPIMRAQGGGMIVNISSMVSKNHYPHLGAYASTKYALNALSLTARKELEKDGIIVCLMHPQLTETDFGRNALKADATARAMEARRRPGMPEPDSAEHVAGRILLAIETGQAETYPHDAPPGAG